jgi:hypothetical protein
MDWSTLPTELLCTIFSYLSFTGLNSASCVHAAWNSIVSNDNAWKEAISRSPFPYHHSLSPENIPWDQAVQNYFSTKKNIVNKSCVQFTLGTRCPTDNPRANIILRNQSVRGKYCLLVWEVMESQGNSRPTHDHLATELWDLETRTIIRIYQQQNLELFNDYVIEHEASDVNTSQTVRYAKFDPATELTLENTITITKNNRGSVTVVKNEDPNSSLILLAWNDSKAKKKVIHVYDLRTGSKILDKNYGLTNVTLGRFFCSKLVAYYWNSEKLRILDVFQDTEVAIEEVEKISYATIAANEVWIVGVNRNYLIKYNLKTMRRRKYDITVDGNVFEIRMFHGIIWIYAHGNTGVKVHLIDVSSTNCQAIGEISIPGWEELQITQLNDGSLSCFTSSYSYILSFRDEDISLPIQVLQIETNGQNKILSIQQCDLNALVSKYSTNYVSSQIVYEDETQRYCLIFSHPKYHTSWPVNAVAEKAKKWPERVQYRKTGIFQLVHFNMIGQSAFVGSDTLQTAYGPCWVFYETKVSRAAWQRTSPADRWLFFKTKLGLE